MLVSAFIPYGPCRCANVGSSARRRANSTKSKRTDVLFPTTTEAHHIMLLRSFHSPRVLLSLLMGPSAARIPAAVGLVESSRVNRNNNVWASELKAFNGRVWLYYSISTFGSKNSLIGLASAPSVGSGQWRDDGLVIRTTSADNYNAIDPDLVIDAEGNPWLALGSWNSGIKITRLDRSTMKPTGRLYCIATRPNGIEPRRLCIAMGTTTYSSPSANAVPGTIAPIRSFTVALATSLARTWTAMAPT